MQKLERFLRETKATRKQFVVGLAIGIANLTNGCNYIPPRQLPKKDITPSFIPSPTPLDSLPTNQENYNQVSFLLFPTANTTEKNHVKNWTDEQLKHLEEKFKQMAAKQGNKDSWKDMLKKTAQKVNAFDKDIIEIGKNLGYSPNSPILEILPALIFEESLGEQKAKSPSGATGLCQLHMPTAKDMLTRLRSKQQESGVKKALDNIRYVYNPNTKSYEPDLEDKTTNITLALEYLNYLYGLFPDTATALWAYNIGPGNMRYALQTYMAKDIHKPIDIQLDSINMYKGTEEERRKAMKQNGSYKVMQENNINFINLYSSDAVIEELTKKGVFKTNTKHYVTRIAAAYIILNTIL